MRKATLKKISDLSEIFEVVKGFSLGQLDPVKEAVSEQKQSKLSKRASLVRVTEETNSLLGFFKKLL